MTLSRRLFLIKNLLSVCSAPMEVLISVLYWSIRIVSRQSISCSMPTTHFDQIDKRLVIPDWVVLPLHAGRWMSMDAK